MNTPSKVGSVLNGYINRMVNFGGDTKNGLTITNAEIRVREMQLAIPAGTTAEEWAAINKQVAYAKTNGIDVIITVIKP